MPPDGHLPLPPSLTYLSLSNNLLNGPIPSSLTNLTSLQSFDLVNCSLSGMLPAAPLPRALTSLSLGLNNLSGSVPWAAWALPDSITTLSLAANRLAGPLPTTLPASLEALYLGGNVFSGSLPAELLGSLPTNFSQLDVSNNRLTGRLPQAVTLPPGKPKYGMPTDIDLSSNSFSGPLPSWSSSGALRYDSRLNFSSNQLTGMLPANPAWLSFATVDLSLNRLTGGQRWLPSCARRCWPLVADPWQLRCPSQVPALQPTYCCRPWL